MAWIEEDVCKKKFLRYISNNLYLFLLFLLICDFFGLVHTSDSMIGNVRSLLTSFRFEHRQVKSQRSPSITAIDNFVLFKRYSGRMPLHVTTEKLLQNQGH